MKGQPINILVVDDDDAFRVTLIHYIRDFFSTSGAPLVFHGAADKSSALALLKEHRMHIALLDMNFPSEPDGTVVRGNGINLLRHISGNYPTVHCIGMTANETVSAGGFTFLDKTKIKELKAAIGTAIAAAQSSPKAGPTPTPK